MEKREIYLAGGCFWGTEAYMKKIPGILATEVGYANSRRPHPNYESVCSGLTGAVECVRVIYDGEIVPLSLLLKGFFRTIDPTSLNAQGNDRGTQYRTGVYWSDPLDAPVVRRAVAFLQLENANPVVVECIPLQNYSRAEMYHQDHLAKNPFGYCHVNLADADRFVREHARDFGRATVKVMGASGGALAGAAAREQGALAGAAAREQSAREQGGAFDTLAAREQGGAFDTLAAREQEEPTSFASLVSATAAAILEGIGYSSRAA